MTTVETVRELHPLPPDTLMDGLQEGIPPDPLEHSSSTPTDTTPLENESIIQWAQRLGYLSKFDAPALGSMFNDVIGFLDDKDNNPHRLTSTDIMSRIQTSLEAQLTKRKRSERMFSSVMPNLNPYSNKMGGMTHQLVYDHRFQPYLNSKLYTSHTILNYTSLGLEQTQLSNVLKFGELKRLVVGDPPQGNTCFYQSW